MKLRLEEAADKWLTEKGFSYEDKEELLELLDKHGATMKKGETELIILPKGTSDKVAALFDLLYIIQDSNGVPTCFEESAITIPQEAQERYREGMELLELEKEAEMIRNAKQAREHSDPRRRGSKYG